MKTITLLTVLLLFFAGGIAAQEQYIASPVRLSKEAIGKISSVITENALIKLNNQNDEFTFAIRLYPILTSSSTNDSITTMNQNLVVDYKAEFPIDDLDFFDVGYEGKTYSLNGDLTIYNITRPLLINFYLHESTPEDINAKNIRSYPVRISFAFEINPAEYGLDYETANFTEKIIIIVENGIINKPSANYF
ncbi:MAG TPA: hypothetical protein VGC65_04030 [Bacteroidia bacterium]|jgi:hypothetical protein